MATERQVTNSRSSENFSMSSSNRGDDDNGGVTDEGYQGQSLITKTFDNATDQDNRDSKPGDGGPDERSPMITGAGDQADQGLIPEAMPLYQRKISLLNSKEPDIYARMKRGIMN